MPEADRVLILGAGAGGLRAALALDRLLIGRRESPVLVVDQHAYHTVRPHVSDVVAGAATPESVRIPIRRLLGARRIAFQMARVERLDLANRTIITSSGPLGYRWLIVALGAGVATRGLPGVAEHAMRLEAWEDARRIGDAAAESLRQAAWKLEPAEREALSTIVVVGAGLSGVELAGALADRVRVAVDRYHLGGSGRILLLEKADRVLPGYDRTLGDAARDALRRKGVAVRTGAEVVGVGASEVALASGENIRRGVLVWAGGVEAPAVVRASGVPLDQSGRLIVDRQLRLPEHPGVYAVGDGCAVLGEGMNAAPPPAQLAIAQGDVAAHNVYAEMIGGAPREYRATRPDLVIPVGRDDAVAQVRGVVVAGWRAVALRRLGDLRYLEAIGGPSGLLANLR